MSVISKTWVTAEEAAALLSEANGRNIHGKYVYVLAARHQIRSARLHRNAVLFHRGDCSRRIKEHRQLPLRG